MEMGHQAGCGRHGDNLGHNFLFNISIKCLIFVVASFKFVCLFVCQNIIVQQWRTTYTKSEFYKVQL